jgi:hypothetical protein
VFLLAETTAKSPSIMSKARHWRGLSQAYLRILPWIVPSVDTHAHTHAHARAHVLSAHTKKRCMPLLASVACMCRVRWLRLYAPHVRSDVVPLQHKDLCANAAVQNKTHNNRHFTCDVLGSRWSNLNYRVKMRPGFCLHAPPRRGFDVRKIDQSQIVEHLRPTTGVPGGVAAEDDQAVAPVEPNAYRAVSNSRRRCVRTGDTGELSLVLCECPRSEKVGCRPDGGAGGEEEEPEPCSAVLTRGGRKRISSAEQSPTQAGAVGGERCERQRPRFL